MSPAVRKFALTIHLTCSVGWIGAVLAYLALGLAAVTSPDAQTVRAAWTGMQVTGWSAIVPLAIASLLTGLVMSLGTHWGLFRHYWVLISLALTILCTVVLVLHMPTVSTMAALAQHADGADLRALGGDLFHPAVGLLVLLAIAVLNVYKPAGVTPYGWRKQREQRNGLQRSTRRATSSVSLTLVAGTDVHQPSSRFSAAVARVGYFTLHFAEMFVAMMVGMMIFVPVRLALTAQGYTALLDGTSIDFQAWMAAFMVAPMATWMRVRGCNWRNGVEMSAVMLLPIAAVIALRGIGRLDTVPWLANSEHTAMLVGMLVLMLYRREHYTSVYSFSRRPSAAAKGRSFGAQHAEAEQPSARAAAK
jgi:ABC-type multidrug transport system fused ATPase/permease subunit